MYVNATCYVNTLIDTILYENISFRIALQTLVEFIVHLLVKITLLTCKR